MVGGGTFSGVAGGPAGHAPVLLAEVAECLNPAPGRVFIDGTFGHGGYSRAILGAGAEVIAIDRDPDAIEAGGEVVRAYGSALHLFQGRFSELDRIARVAGFEAVDGVVLDVGVSSMQLDQPGRGFSFGKDGPLDMRMERVGINAADIVNGMAPRDLARVIAILGEERKSGLVARAIAAARADRPLTRTSELAAIVERAVGRRPTDPIHPATRTFQALRIFVNRELEELADGLGAAERILKEGGRLVVVAFHSLEDRIVKRFLGERSRQRFGGSRHQPEAAVAPATFELITRTPVVPGAEEINTNPRARSAKLRAAIRTGAPTWPLDPATVGVPTVPSFS